jgi:hypothetical protein
MNKKDWRFRGEFSMRDLNKLTGAQKDVKPYDNMIKKMGLSQNRI